MHAAGLSTRTFTASKLAVLCLLSFCGVALSNYMGRPPAGAVLAGTILLLLAVAGPVSTLGVLLLEDIRRDPTSAPRHIAGAITAALLITGPVVLLFLVDAGFSLSRISPPWPIDLVLIVGFQFLALLSQVRVRLQPAPSPSEARLSDGAFRDRLMELATRAGAPLGEARVGVGEKLVELRLEGWARPDVIVSEGAMESLDPEGRLGLLALALARRRWRGPLTRALGLLVPFALAHVLHRSAILSSWLAVVAALVGSMYVLPVVAGLARWLEDRRAARAVPGDALARALLATLPVGLAAPGLFANLWWEGASRDLRVARFRRVAGAGDGDAAWFDRCAVVILPISALIAAYGILGRPLVYDSAAIERAYVFVSLLGAIPVAHAALVRPRWGAATPLAPMRVLQTGPPAWAAFTYFLWLAGMAGEGADGSTVVVACFLVGAAVLAAVVDHFRAGMAPPRA